MKNKICLSALLLACCFILINLNVQAEDTIAIPNDGTPSASTVDVEFSVAGYLVCSTPKTLTVGASEPRGAELPSVKGRCEYRIGLLGSIPDTYSILISPQSFNFIPEYKVPGSANIVAHIGNPTNVLSTQINTTTFSFTNLDFTVDRKPAGKFSGDFIIDIKVIDHIMP